MGKDPAAHYDRTLAMARLGGEGPRERMLRSGVESLTDRDLLAAVLGTGYAGASVAEVADGVLKQMTLDAMARLAPRDVRRLRGLGTARACQLMAAFEIGRRVLWPGALDRPPYPDAKRRTAFDSAVRDDAERAACRKFELRFIDSAPQPRPQTLTRH